MMNKRIKIEGMPEIVEVELNGKKSASARINLDSLRDDLNIDNLSKAIVMLRDLGFTYYGRDYSLGYYDSVDDITLEFTNRNYKPHNP